MKLPKIVCREMEEEKCISLPYTKEEVVELERCSAVLGPEKCEDAEIIVPKQVKQIRFIIFNFKKIIFIK